VFAAFLSPYLHDMGVAVAWVGVFYSIADGIAALTAPVAGVLTDTLGRRPVLGVARLLRLVGLLTVVMMPGPPWVVAGAIFLGLAGMSNVALGAVTAESTPAERRATAYAVLGTIDSAVNIAGPPLVGLAAERAGMRTALLFALIPLLLSLLPVLSLRETTNRTGQDGGGRSRSLAALAYILSAEGRGALLMGVMWFLAGLETGILRPTWAIYVRDRFRVDYLGLGVLTTLSNIGSVAAQLLGGRLGDTFGDAKTMLVSFGLSAGVWAAVPLARSLHGFSVFAFLSRFGPYIAAPVWETVGANASHRSVRGTVNGVYRGLIATGAALGAVLGGALYNHDRSLPFYALAGLEALMLVLTTLGISNRLRGFRKRPVDDD